MNPTELYDLNEFGMHLAVGSPRAVRAVGAVRCRVHRAARSLRVRKLSIPGAASLLAPLRRRSARTRFSCRAHLATQTAISSRPRRSRCWQLWSCPPTWRQWQCGAAASWSYSARQLRECVCDPKLSQRIVCANIRRRHMRRRRRRRQGSRGMRQHEAAAVAAGTTAWRCAGPRLNRRCAPGHACTECRSRRARRSSTCSTSASSTHRRSSWPCGSLRPQPVRHWRVSIPGCRPAT